MIIRSRCIFSKYLSRDTIPLKTPDLKKSCDNEGSADIDPRFTAAAKLEFYF